MENENVINQQPVSIRRTSPILYLLLGAIVALGVFFALTRPFNIPEPAGKAPSGAAEKVYSSDVEGFTLRYPAGWNRLSEGELEKYNGAFSFAVERANPRVFLSVKTQTINAENVKLGALARTLDAEIATSFDDAKKLNHEVIKLNDGRQALRYEYSFTSASKTKVREQLLIVPAGQKVFHVSASAGEQDFETVRSELNAMAQSIEIK